jgi:hypothetical protein
MEFIAFPNKPNAIFKDAESRGNKIEIEASGSLGLYYDGKCHKTFPNETIRQDEKMDWCSNVAEKKSGRSPWIMYSIKKKVLRISGYSIRNGCCVYPCCCIDDTHFVDGMCCCKLYSYSVHGSKDNRTWTVIHRVEKDNKFFDCQFKTYEFEKTESYVYIRFMLDEEFPGCPKCMQLNQVELYGETIDAIVSLSADDESEESVSIIGKINRYKKR